MTGFDYNNGKKIQVAKVRFCWRVLWFIYAVSVYKRS
jgi:hypothetical protein